MNRRISRSASLLTVLLVLAQHAGAQEGQLIDGIIAVVGEEPVLYSDLASRMEQAQQAGERVDATTTCGELESMMFEKLLLSQARIDSIEVDEARVDGELDRRIRYYTAQLGGEDKLEAFYGKSISTIKEEFREKVRDQMLVQDMQESLVGDIRVTPRDVEKFFNTIHEDSLPRINAQVEWSQIIKVPKPSDDEKRRARRKAEDLRERVLAGEDFCALATLYSCDPSSKENCGVLGMVSQGVMVPEFDAVALSLKDGEVSQVFETGYGFHFMRMIERRGEQYNAQHLLICMQTSSADQQAMRELLDSVANEVRLGRLDFGKVAGEISDDEETKAMNGMVIEPNTNSARWSMGDLDQQDFFVIDQLKPGEVSAPTLYTMPDGTKAYRLIRLALRTEPHIANLKDDYALFQQAAEGRLKDIAVSDWVKEKIADTYVRVSEGYTGCTFRHQWIRTE